MDNSGKGSKNSNECPEDVKVYIKISKDSKLANCDKKFVIEENKKSIIYQRDLNKRRKFQFDYVFLENENNLNTFNIIKKDVIKYLKNEKNLFFLTFGQEKLGKTKFIFGNNTIIENDSLFKYVYDSVYSNLSEEMQYDNVLIDIFKISNEKYIIDQRNIVHDVKNDLVETINQIIKENSRLSINNSYSYSSDFFSKIGHLFITIKFFKFTDSNEDDDNQELREVEIIRSLTFGDIVGFDHHLVECVKNNTKISVENDHRFHTHLNFKYLVEALSDTDINKFTEITSTLTFLISDILKQNIFIFFFGFMKNEVNFISESMFTLEISNKFKNICPDYFFDILQDIKRENSFMDNKYTKEDFHTLQTIFGELLFYTDKTFSSNFNEKCYDIDFSRKIRDLSHNKKFNFLKEYLQENNYDFAKNKIISEIFDAVMSFFNNRTKWKLLQKAKDDIQKLNLEIKVSLSEICNKEEKSFSENIINQTDDPQQYYSIIREISKQLKNDEDFPDSIFGINPNLSVMSNISEHSIMKNPKTNPISKTTVNEGSTRHSTEISFANFILNEFFQSTKKAMNNIFKKFTEENNCMNCTSAEDLDKVDYKINPEKVLALKSGKQKSKKIDESISDLKKHNENEKENDNNLNIKSFLSKNNANNDQNSSNNFRLPKTERSKKIIIENLTDDNLKHRNKKVRDLTKVFGNNQISNIYFNNTNLSDSVKINFDNTNANKLENYISSNKMKFDIMKKLSDKMNNQNIVVKKDSNNTNKLSDSALSERLAKINSKIQKFVNN